MNHRQTAALLAVVILGSTGLLAASGDTQPYGEWRAHQREAVREIREAVREAVRDVDHDARDVVREVVRAVMRELHAATAWSWSDSDHARAERRRDQAERRREDAGRRRERIEARRDQAAQSRDARAFRSVGPTDDPCRDNDHDRGHACEVRDSRLPAPVGPLTVDAAPNGGIRVEAWDQADVLVRAVVQTWADDDAEAEGAARQRAGHGRRSQRLGRRARSAPTAAGATAGR